jgi:L-alanine-DL-glutamate epimerase-like enolase superfamily enzyme
MSADCTITAYTLRLARIPVDPPRGDAIQQFAALELPLVEIEDAGGGTGLGFGYTIGAGGSAIAALLNDELLPRLIGRDARRVAPSTNWSISRSTQSDAPGSERSSSRSERPIRARTSSASPGCVKPSVRASR